MYRLRSTAEVSTVHSLSSGLDRLLFNGYRLLSMVIARLLFVAYALLPIVCCPLPILGRLSPSVDCLRSIVWGFLAVAYCGLSGV